MIRKKITNVLRLALSVLPLASAATATQVDAANPWEVAQQEDSAQAYTRFILENPESAHVTEALSRIEALQGLAENVTASAADAITPEMRVSDGAARLMNI